VPGIVARVRVAAARRARGGDPRLQDTGAIARLAAKPVMLGAGGNLQRHCAWAVFAGVGFKFNDFIQAIHRSIASSRRGRCGSRSCTARPRPRWCASSRRSGKRYDEQMARMSALLREYGLNSIEAHDALVRSIGVDAREYSGDRLGGRAQRHRRRDDGDGRRCRRRDDPDLDPLRHAVRVHAELQRLRPHRRRRALLAADGLPVAGALPRARAGPRDGGAREGSRAPRRDGRARVPDGEPVPRRRDPPLSRRTASPTSG
jgi:hypothetical protein